jgi:hypothetical protein
MILVSTFGLAWSQQAHPDQPQSRQWLRVGLFVDEFSPPTQKEFQDLFTRQLRKLRDLEVVPVPDGSTPARGRKELPDVN